MAPGLMSLFGACSVAQPTLDDQETCLALSLAALTVGVIVFLTVLELCFRLRDRCLILGWWPFSKRSSSLSSFSASALDGVPRLTMTMPRLEMPRIGFLRSWFGRKDEHEGKLWASDVPTPGNRWLGSNGRKSMV